VTRDELSALARKVSNWGRWGADDERGTILVAVQDNGEGIPPEHRDKVFDLLFSTKGSRGTGFGLAITKKLVQEHSGRVWFHSEVGKGTTVTIALPGESERTIEEA